MSIPVKGKSVHFDDRYLHVELEDGRVILTPMLARQAKLGVSSRVKVPVGQGLANHPYRVLRVRRSVASGYD